MNPNQRLRALCLSKRMSSQEPVQPSTGTFLALLKACSKLKDFESGFQIHVEVVRVGFHQENLRIGSALVDMYCKCASLHRGRQVFDDLLVRDVVCWTSLIAGYAEHGHPEQAIGCVEQMKNEGIIPNGFTFVCSMKACISLRATNKIREMHARVEQQGLPRTDIVVGNTIVDAYAKCGSVLSMQQAFSKLPTKDVISWTALIGGYVEHGHGDRALESFERMQSEGVQPNALTYVYGLKACCSIADRNKGEALHAEIRGKEFAKGNLYLAATLIDMYSSFGSILSANEIFDDVVVRDAALWTSLMGGFSAHGHNENVLMYFDQMKMESALPNFVSLVCCLKACGCTGALRKGQEIHSVLETYRSFESNHILPNALLDMYAKCGSFPTAHRILDGFLVHQNVASWNALIAGYVEHGNDEQALECSKQMRQEGVLSSAVTVMHVLQACAHVRSSWKGMQIHAEIESQRLLEEDPFVGSSLIDMYAKCGSFDRARELLYRLPVRDAVSWTALIAGCVEHGLNEEAMDHLDEMQQLDGVSPDAVVFIWSLKACGCTGNIRKALEIHAELARKWEGLQLDGDLGVRNALLETHATCGSLGIAQDLFDGLRVRDSTGWSTIIAGYAEHGYHAETLECLSTVWIEGIVPDTYAFISGLRCCGCLADTAKGRSIHSEVEKLQLLQENQHLGNALIDMYAKCGLPEEAQEIFDKLQHRDVVSWNALISGYADCGGCAAEKALECFDQMQHTGVLPDRITYVCSLKACCHSSIGATSKGGYYYCKILAEVEKWGSEETGDPCIGSVLVDMHAKRGCLAKAQEVFDSLPVKGIVAWNALLTGYSNHGHGETTLLKYFEQVEPTATSSAATYMCCLRACATMGAVGKGHEIHDEIQRKGMLEGDGKLGSAVVDMYLKCGLVWTAEQVFERLEGRDVVAWTVLIAGYARVGEVGKVWGAMERMRMEGVRPDGLTWIVVLKACSRSGEVGMMTMVMVESMEEQVWMADALGKVGELEGAMESMRGMPWKGDGRGWGAVARICRDLGDLRRGKEAFRNAIMGIEGPAADGEVYVAMAQMCAEEAAAAAAAAGE